LENGSELLSTNLSIDDIVRALQIRTNDFSGVKARAYGEYAMDVYRDLQLNIIKTTKLTKLKLDRLKRAKLPIDYINYASINIMNDCMELEPVAVNPSIETNVIDTTIDNHCSCQCGCSGSLCNAKNNYIYELEDGQIYKTFAVSRIEIDLAIGYSVRNIVIDATIIPIGAIITNQQSATNMQNIVALAIGNNNFSATVVGNMLILQYKDIITNFFRAEVDLLPNASPLPPTLVITAFSIETLMSEKDLDKKKEVRKKICENGDVIAEYTSPIQDFKCIASKFHFDATSMNNTNKVIVGFGVDGTLMNCSVLANDAAAILAFLAANVDATTTVSVVGTITSFTGTGSFHKITSVKYVDSTTFVAALMPITPKESFVACGGHVYSQQVPNGSTTTTQKTENLCSVELKKCGCIDESLENEFKVKEAKLDICCIKQCSNPCDVSDGKTYNIVASEGVIKMGVNFPDDTIYLKYHADPTAVSDYFIPIIAKNAMIRGIYKTSIEYDARVSDGAKREACRLYDLAKSELYVMIRRYNLKNFYKTIGIIL
jgi:hypothetical protein